MHTIRPRSSDVPALVTMVLALAALVPCSQVYSEEAEKKATRKIAENQVGSVQAEWLPKLPVTVLGGERNAVDPVALRAASGALLVAAESREGRSVLLLSRSEDGGASWQAPREMARAAEGSRVTAGAAGVLPSGRLILVMHEWRDAPGKVTWVSDGPRGVHHYSWAGFGRTSALDVLLSDDEGKTWTPATCDTAGGPIAPSAMGRAFAERGALWLAVHGPADGKEMDAALSGVGLIRSDDGGQTWLFSHWVARADKDKGIGYGPGEITVLPDGRWLGMLQGNYRGLGDYTRPRICRTLSSDAGRTWSRPVATLLGPKPSLVLLDRDQIMVGTRQDRGVIYNVTLNAGADLLYQDQLWECIWYQGGNRGGLGLLKLDDDTILATFHWMDRRDIARCEIRSQLVRRRHEFRVELPPPARPARSRGRWMMAEAYQVPDIAEAPAGIRIGTLLKLASGDWMAIGFAEARKGGVLGFAVSGLVVLRSPTIEGPWRKVAALPTGDVISDTGAGANMPGEMMQTRSGRLLLPFPVFTGKLLYSDDEGMTWGLLPRKFSATIRIQERQDGSLLWPPHVARGGARTDLFCAISTDDGATWDNMGCWAKSLELETHYDGLAHGRNGWVRAECALVTTDGGRWLGIYREERGTLAPADHLHGPSGMPHLMLTRSEDAGKSWTPAFGFLGVEPVMAVLPDGAVLVAYRQDNVAAAWLSYDEGRTWQAQLDPAEMPWRRDSAEAYTQWPPGGEPTIRVLDADTAVVICDTGLLPSGKPLPPGHKVSRELHGRAQVRFFRRTPSDGP